MFVLACQSSNSGLAEKTPAKQEAQIESSAPRKSSLVYKMHEPTNKSKTAPLLILLHGRGSNESIFYSMAPKLDNRLRVVSVQGPLKMGADKFAWFDLQRNKDGLRQYDEAEVLEMSDQLVEFIKELVAINEWRPSEILIGGFSQGAIMSLGTGLRHPRVIDGVLCMSGAMFPEFSNDFVLQDEHKDLSILVTHGRNDLVLPFEEIASAVDFLRSHDFEVTFKQYDSAHNFPPENFTDFREWLAQKLDN